MNHKILLIFFSLFGFYSCERFSQKEYFDRIVYDAFHMRYDGVVVNKYFDKNNHNSRILVIENKIFGIESTDFTLLNPDVFDFIKIGDTLFKARKSLELNINRKGLDTIINIHFKNIKGYQEYYLENPYLSAE